MGIVLTIISVLIGGPVVYFGLKLLGICISLWMFARALGNAVGNIADACAEARYSYNK